jgi:hypothetical protein
MLDRLIARHETSSLFHTAADYTAIYMGVGVALTPVMEFLDSSERLIAGALVIALLILRIRSQRRRDKAEKK